MTFSFWALRKERWVRIVLLTALPVILYLFIVEQLSWRPRVLKPGHRKPSINHLNYSPMLAFSSHSDLLATLDDHIEMWDVHSGRLIWSQKKYATGALVFSPDGKLLSTGGTSGEDGAVNLWNAYTGALLRTLKHTARPITFSPDGRTLVCVPATRTLELWDVTSGQLLHRLSGHISSVEEAVFAADGKTMVSGADDGTVIWWDTRTGKLLRTLKSRPEWVGIIAFSPDAKLMATGRDSGIKIWNAQTGALLQTLTKPGEGYYPGSFTNDGKSLIGIGAGPSFGYQALTSRDVQTGSLTPLRTLHCYQEFSYALSPNGSTLATGEATGAIKLWRAK